MIQLPKNETKLMVAVHGWTGVILGLLLYAVVMTGMAAVFAEEIGIWSAGHTETRSAFQRPIADSVRALGARTPAKFHEAVDVFEVGDHDLGIFFHRHETSSDGQLVSRGIFYELGKAGQVVSTRTGTDEDVFGPSNDNALSSFLVDTHVRLHIPNPWGLILTGMLGLAMLVAAISGLLIHRHLFKDIFTLRRNANRVLFNRDRHSVAGTWSLPFAFILAFTGSFFSFFGTIGVPIVAMAAFGGNVQALNEAVFGNQVKPDARSVLIGNLDLVSSDAIRRTGQVPTFMSIDNFGRADSKVTTFHPPKSGDITPVSLVYDGATGTFDRIKPLIGTKPSTGGTLAAIMSPLHFGNFAGLVSKALWFGLGFAMCYVTFTGLRLWLVRREKDRRSLDWLERIVAIVGLGLPVALVATATGFLITRPLGSATYWTPASFVIASALVMIAGAVWPSVAKLGLALQRGTGLLMLALPPLRLLTGGPGWPHALAAGQPIIVAVDIAFLFAGGCILWCARSVRRENASDFQLALQAAE